MESDGISTIVDWPTPNSIRDVLVLLGFVNFYRRFIPEYAKMTPALVELLQNSAKAAEPPKGKRRP
jgi:hypothetical protein